jgi:hypothetical protein
MLTGVLVTDFEHFAILERLNHAAIATLEDTGIYLSATYTKP